jgi:hypothetical protein
MPLSTDFGMMEEEKFSFSGNPCTEPARLKTDRRLASSL